MMTPMAGGYRRMMGMADGYCPDSDNHQLIGITDWLQHLVAIMTVMGDV